jgi:pyruvate/2-oxoglutarate dehydrogenase complex dihydrolipoamide acyltransferase (E2) component
MVSATDAAIALADEAGISLNDLAGTGKDGRITVRDVRDVLTAEEGVVAAVKRDLADMGAVGRSALAASALALARELDNPENSATSKSMCAKALIETMDRLRAQAPPKKENDRLDELAARRAARVA